MKMYQNCLIVGRFQPLTRGHEYLIRQALKLSKKVYIYIGSAQESGTWKNPFTYNIRKRMFEATFKNFIKHGRLFVSPLNDIGLGDTVGWGEYILNTIKMEYDVIPDLYITGCEKERTSWFNNEIAPTMDELRVSRRWICSTATEVRERMCEPDFDSVYISADYIPFVIADDKKFRKKLCEIAKEASKNA